MKVVICLEEGNAEEIVLQESIKWLANFPEAEVEVYTVMDISTLIVNPEEGNMILMESLQDGIEAMKKRVNEMFGKRVVKFVSETGFPAEEAIKYVQHSKCDLLILGTHGRTGLSHLLLGSVAEKILRNIECATLVIPVKGKV